MVTVILFVLYLFVFICANPTPNQQFLGKSLLQNLTNVPVNGITKEIKGRNAAVDLRFGTGFTDVTDFTRIPYTVAIYCPEKNTFMGLGVIINNRWFLTSAYTADVYSVDLGFNYFAYQSIADPATLPTTTVKNQKILETIIHPNYQASNFVYNVALSKVCPPFVTRGFVKLPPPSSVNYDTSGSTVVTIYIYYKGTGKLSTTTNVIADHIVCSDDMSTYDVTNHFCAVGATIEHGVKWADEIATAIYLDANGRIIGVGSDDGKDDFRVSSVVKIENFYDWINTNTAY